MRIRSGEDAAMTAKPEDLQGYLVIPNVLGRAEVAELNRLFSDGPGAER